ncbi:MAG: hypothetical protein IT289_06140 [Oligoflexia bacterium]|nr:hypothetical protein [Oligoflexia bacterium]
MSLSPYDRLLEDLTAQYTGPDYKQEVMDAKREFFERAGIVDEESTNFETRMSQFLDWYIFSRELSTAHLPPAQFHLEKNRDKLADTLLPLYENLTKTVHSLYEFLKLRDTDVYVRDLLSKKKYILENSTITAGFNPSEIFEARLIPYEKTWVFTRGFCFHPLEASGFIQKEIKQVRHLDQTHKEALMLKLMKMRYKFEQYKHIKLEFIYTNDAKLRI